MPKVKECEVLVLYEAISWVASLGYENVMFEIDSQLVVKELEHNPDDGTEFGVILSGVSSLSTTSNFF